MRLYLIRHAWAFERDAQRWPDDRERPLTEAGVKRFRRMMKRAAKAKVEPAYIATSPLVRCRQTADLVAERLDASPKIVEIDALAPGSDLKSLVDWSGRHSATEIAWVGHAPDVEELAAVLICGSAANIRFAKGAIACIEFDAAVWPGAGRLLWLATAKLLGV